MITISGFKTIEIFKCERCLGVYEDSDGAIRHNCIFDQICNCCHNKAEHSFVTTNCSKCKCMKFIGIVKNEI